MSRAFISIPADKYDAIFGKPAAEPKPKRRRQRKPKAEAAPVEPPPAAEPSIRFHGVRSATVPAPKLNRQAGPEPGIYEDVPFAEYLAWPHVNNTLLAEAAKSMAHFRHAQLNGLDFDSRAMVFGHLVHLGTLQPDVLNEFYVIMPDFAAQVMREKPEVKSPRSTNRYRELVADFQSRTDREIVDQADYDAMAGILASLAANERAAEYLDDGNGREVSIVWDDPDTGIRCKARLDCWDADACRVTDLKTTRDAGNFSGAIAAYGYDRQAAFYSDGIAVLTGKPHEFAIIAAETSAPYAVRCAPVGWTTLDGGQAEYKRLLRQIAECRRDDYWPSYGDPDAWETPGWNNRQLTLQIAGATLTM